MDDNLSNVMEALKTATAAGNHDAAQKLATMATELQAARTSRPQEAPAASAPPSPPTTSGFAGARQFIEDTAGGALTAVDKADKWIGAHAPFLQLNKDHPLFADGAAGRAGASLKSDAAGINYQPETTQEAYQKGGLPGVAGNWANRAIASAPLAIGMSVAPEAVGPIAGLGMTENYAEDRAKLDGRQDPGLADYAMAGLTAGGQELAGRMAGRAMMAPTGASALARIASTATIDAGAGAASGLTGYLGTHLGTKAGVSLPEAGQEALEGAGSGAVGGVAGRSVAERLPVDRETARGLKGEAIVAKQGEEQSASNMRVAQMAEQVRKSADDAGTGGMVPQDSNAYKTVQGSLIQKLRGTVDDLAQSGQIDKEERRSLIGQRGSLLDEAAVHNRVFGQDHLDRIDTLDVADDVKQALQDGFRDLNTSTYNAMYKNGTGPLEKAAKWAAYPTALGAAGIAGLHGEGLVGAVGVPIVAKGIQAAGRFGDQLLGNRTPPAEASLTALRAAALKRSSLADAAARDTHGALETIRQGVEQTRLAAKAKDTAAKAAKVTAKQQAEIDRQRLMSAVSPDAPISGGHLASVANWFRKEGHAATLEHVQEAVDRLNARGGFSSPEQYQAAREGHEFPGETLTPLFRETGAVLADHGIHADTDVKAGEKADAAITRAKVRAIVAEAMPKAPRSPAEAPSVANTNQRPPQAPPVPRGPRKAPGGSAKAPPSTTGFEEGRRLHAYAATTFRAKMAEEQAIRSAGDRLDLQETASHIAGLEHKDAKAQAYEEALRKYHGDTEALRFVMGPLRTLAGIGGKSEQTAHDKAVIRVRSKKTSS